SADTEARALEATTVDRAGHQLTPEQHADVKRVTELHDTVIRAERGELDPVEANDRISKLLGTKDGDLSAPHTEAPPLAPEETSPEGFLPGSVGSAQVGKISNIPDQGVTAMAKARLDIFAKLNKSDNPLIRELGFLFVKDPIATDKFYA